MGLEQFLKRDLIWIKAPCKKPQDIFEMVALKAREGNRVTENFLEKILERERVFPTGLQLDGYAVAIPHTDPECVNEQFIAVITSDEGILFNRMDDPNEEVIANAIFMLGLNEPHNQLEVLQQLVAILQDRPSVEKMLLMEDETDIIKLLSKLSIVK